MKPRLSLTASGDDKRNAQPRLHRGTHYFHNLIPFSWSFFSSVLIVEKFFMSAVQLCSTCQDWWNKKALCVAVSDAERGEISLRRWSASGGSIRAALLVSHPSANGYAGGAEQGHVGLTSLTKQSVTFLGHLYEEKQILQLYMENGLSSRLSYRLFLTFLLEKQRLSPAKKL